MSSYVFFLVAALSFPTAASAATIVMIDLWDKGAAAEMATNLGYVIPLADASKASMGVKLSSASAPAGDVTFQVANTSKDTVHELLVVPMTENGQPPAYSEKDSRIDEKTADGLGEVHGLAVGTLCAVTLNLKPGKYLLICNIAGHYMADMWASFTVTP